VFMGVIVCAFIFMVFSEQTILEISRDFKTTLRIVILLKLRIYRIMNFICCLPSAVFHFFSDHDALLREFSTDYTRVV